MTEPSRRLAVLFVLSLVGVAVAVGLFAYRVGGLPALLVVVAATGLLLGLGVAKARSLALAQQRRPAGRTCTCCTSSQHDPVRVI